MARQTTGRPLNIRPSSGRSHPGLGLERGWSGDTTGNPAIGSRRMVGGDGTRAAVLEGAQIERRGAVPYSVALPPVAELKTLESAELAELLQRYGVLNSWEGLRIEAAKYIERVATRAPTIANAQALADELVSSESQAGLRRLAKTVYRETSAYEALAGRDPREVLFIRLGEGDKQGEKNQCDECARLAGVEGTMLEHIEWGLPGGGSCAGGADCRCELVEVEVGE